MQEGKGSVDWCGYILNGLLYCFTAQCGPQGLALEVHLATSLKKNSFASDIKSRDDIKENKSSHERLKLKGDSRQDIFC